MNRILIPFLFVCFLISCNQPTSDEQNNSMQNVQIDWQGHRGARGLLPENSIPAFLLALEFPVTTLELDLAVSKDDQLIVSHDPWMSASICKKTDGSDVGKSEEEELLIMEMTYEEIRQFDCGSRGNSRFKDQKPMKVYKPSFADVVESVKQYCEKNGRPFPNFNIEIKSQTKWDAIKTPKPSKFAHLVVEEIQRLGIKERTTIQSFDLRSLQAAHQLDSTLSLAFLIDDLKGVDKNLEELGFVPDIYSPHYLMVSKNVVDVVHDKGMKLIPWTVNDIETMQMLIKLGVDGIITDYPNKIQTVMMGLQEK